jgi:hypothetical protein
VIQRRRRPGRKRIYNNLVGRVCNVDVPPYEVVPVVRAHGKVRSRSETRFMQQAGPYVRMNLPDLRIGASLVTAVI